MLSVSIIPSRIPPSIAPGIEPIPPNTAAVKARIPGMEPVIDEETRLQKTISLADQEKKEREEKELEKMASVFYKSEYKVYIFKGDEMYDDEFIEALDNSPTYKRTTAELERIVESLVQHPAAVAPTVTEQEPSENVEIAEVIAEEQQPEDNEEAITPDNI